MYDIAYKVCDDKTKNRIGFVIVARFTNDKRLCTAEEAAYLAYNGKIINTSAKLVKGKPVLVGHGESALGFIPEITLEEAKRLLNKDNNGNTYTIQSINPDNIFILNIFSVVNTGKQVQGLSDGSMARIDIKCEESMSNQFGYDFVSTEDISLLGQNIKAGTLFFVKWSQLGELVKAFGNRTHFGNGDIKLDDGGNQTIISVDFNVNWIIMGHYSAYREAYICDELFQAKLDTEYLKGYQVSIQAKSGSTNINLGNAVYFRSDQAEVKNTLGHAKSPSERRLALSNISPIKISDELLKLLSTQSVAVASKAITGVDWNGVILDRKAYNKMEYNQDKPKKQRNGIFGLINMFNR